MGVPNQIVLGLEVEYALASQRGPEALQERRCLPETILRQLRRYPHLQDRGRTGLHLGNGCNVYVDTGRHLEFGTPEVTNPRDIVLWEKAGERLLEKASEEVQSERDIGVYKNNVDYAGHTWGCHENYLVSRRLSFERIAKELLPFLITRQIYAGSGKISCVSGGIGFELSQRAAFIEVAVSRETVGCRGILNTRDEHLSTEQYRRVHLILGDSLMSERGTFLKIGTTALLLRMMDVGVHLGDGFEFDDPVEVLHFVSRDPLCRRALRTTDGRSVTATEVQRHYLTRAEDSIGKRGIPEWGELVVREWRSVLDQLEADPLSLRSCLDPYIKFDLYSRLLQRWGSSWDHVNKMAPGKPARREPEELVVLRQIFGEEGVLHLECLLSAMREREPGPKPSPLAQKLMALDISYHDVRRRSSLFYSLEQQGLLEHRVVTEDEIASAMVSSPPDTRAAVRGRVIRQFSGLEAGVATWYAIWVPGRVLDLRDPFETDEKWRASTEEGL